VAKASASEYEAKRYQAFRGAAWQLDTERRPWKRTLMDLASDSWEALRRIQVAQNPITIN
jgi:hypothetical protein